MHHGLMYGASRLWLGFQTIWIESLMFFLFACHVEFSSTDFYLWYHAEYDVFHSWGALGWLVVNGMWHANALIGLAIGQPLQDLPGTSVNGSKNWSHLNSSNLTITLIEKTESEWSLSEHSSLMYKMIGLKWKRIRWLPYNDNMTLFKNDYVCSVCKTCWHRVDSNRLPLVCEITHSTTVLWWIYSRARLVLINECFTLKWKLGWKSSKYFY